MRIAVAGGTGTVGTMVVGEARARGHEVRVLARGDGVDLTTGRGAADALAGTDAVMDVLSIGTQDAAAAERFFAGTTRVLLAAERDAGVGHHLALSIVGIDRAPYDYYVGKIAQERSVEAGGIPWTILRATQFHEFAAQMYDRAVVAGIHLAPRMRTQPVAAREVAARLVELAEAPAVGRARDLAGPREESLARMVKAYARSRGIRRWIPSIPLPGAFGRAQRDGSLLPGPDVDLGSETFEEWLARTRG